MRIFSILKNRVFNPIKNVCFNIKLKKEYKIQRINVGKNTLISNCKFEGKINIGSNCIVKSSEIGKYTYLGDNVYLEKTVVGRFCSIAKGVTVIGGDYPLNFISTHQAFYSKNYAYSLYYNENFKELNYCNKETKKFVEIGNDVWIATDVKILAGVSIGHGAIIGAGAVVTKNVPPYAVVVGVPAKIIKYRFNEIQIEQLLCLRWWDSSDALLKKIAKDMNNIENIDKLITEITNERKINNTN